MQIRVAPLVAAAVCLLPAAGARAAVDRKDDATVATVNGERITYAQWQTRLEGLRGQDFILTLNPLRLKGETAGQLAMRSLVTGRLILQYAAKTSLLPTDAEVSAGLEGAKRQASVQQALAAGRVTEDQVRDDVRLQQAVYNIATINQRATPEEAKAYFQQHPEQFGTPERWQLAAIRVSTKEAANKVLDALRGGTPFATAVAQYSEDAASKAHGGLYDPVSATDPGLPDTMRSAVSKLKVGEYTAPIETTVGGKPQYMIVRLVQRDQATMPPFEQVQDRAGRAAVFAKVGGAAAVDKKLEDFRKTSRIAIALPGYEHLFDETAPK